jgi:hypothetical protein
MGENLMETRRLGRGGIVAFAIFVAIVASWLLARHAPKKVVPFSFVSAQMNPCPSTPTNIAYTIRVVVPANFSGALVYPAQQNPPQRQVFYEPGATGAARDIPPKGQPLPGLVNGINDPNLFNMSLTGLSLSGVSSSPQPYAVVRVILQDIAEYKWYQQRLPDGTVIDGAADGGLVSSSNGNNNASLGLCGAAADPLTGTPTYPYPVVLFYAPLYSGPSAPDTIIGSFNIGVVPLSMPATPILIDPKMMNNG